MSTLVLNLRKEYFEQIRSGVKTEEFRLCTPYWAKRLEGRNFELVEIRCGYPKRGDNARIITKRFSGVVKKTITHPHFGPAPVQVYAIQLAEASTWPFPPPGGPKPWTAAQKRAYAAQQRQQMPVAPF